MSDWGSDSGTSVDSGSGSALGSGPDSVTGVPENLYQGKKWITKAYADHPITFYCRCTYHEKTPDLQSCGYRTRKNHKRSNHKRAKRIEWEHVVPASRLGQDLSCWQAPKSKRGGLSSRKYCRKVSEEFNRREGDPMNLVPAVGEVNADRSNYLFVDMGRITKGKITLDKGPYGRCSMRIFRWEMDGKNRRLASPPSHVRGDIARIYRAMDEKYDLNLSGYEKTQFTRWDGMDPEDAWEIKRRQRIENGGSGF